MRVVSNTSPILNLAIVDHLHLLREQMSEVFVPLRAHHEGRVSALDPVLVALEDKAGFFVGKELRRQIEGRR